MKFYENFHQGVSFQKRVINKDNFTYKHIIKLVQKNLLGRKKILDIGCGAGTLSFYFANLGYAVDGIDISKNAIDSCKKSALILKLKNTEFKVMDFPRSIPKKKYDLIICSEVLEHIKNDRIALKKIYGLLNLGGIAVLTTPSVNAPLYRLGLAKEFDKRVGHLRRYSLEQLILICTGEGFKVIASGKTEGVLRNFLYLNSVAGKLVRFTKYFIADLVTFVDNIVLKIFGESNIYIVINKPL